MSRKYFIIIIILFVLIVGTFAYRFSLMRKNTSIETPSQNVSSSANSNSIPQHESPATQPEIQNQTSNFVPPLDKASERVTKKPFGIYITPQNSPVQPERFQGYHTGTDFEIFPEELNADVLVHTVCSGKLLVKRFASGYGGVAVESCQLNDNPITVVYGHLKLSSISANVGADITAGETLGILGANKSVETDGERKHLHLGFHNGSAINIRGYVANKLELSGWLDPCLYVCSP